MPHADFELSNDGTVFTPGHGGARANAGRKTKDYVPPPEVKAFNESKARNEAAKADLNELDFKVKSGQYLERAAFREASATLLAELTQGLRGLPDTLERDHNLKPDAVQAIADQIDAALASVAAGLELFYGGE
ncbi:MAG: hypothetical protein RL684_658 [Pseudomonadota bacterium]